MAAIDDVNKQFDYARQKVAQNEAASTQAKRDALARKQAQLGGGPGGGFIKADQQVLDQSARNINDANQGIDIQQNAEIARLREVDEGRKFQVSERQATQQFASGERQASQQFASGERIGGQKFTAEQNAANMSQQAKQFEANRRLQEAGITGKYDGNDTLAARQYADQNAMANNEFLENIKTNRINSIISMYNSKISPEKMGALLKDLNVTFDENGVPVVDLPEVKGLTKANPKEKKVGAGPPSQGGPSYGTPDALGNVWINDTQYKDKAGTVHTVGQEMSSYDRRK
jgi:hypothetical protein